MFLPSKWAVVLTLVMAFSTWTITDRSYCNFLYGDNITADEVSLFCLWCNVFCGNISQDYFLRLRVHHYNLLALSWEEKAALVPSFEGQLVPLAEHIVQLRRRPEFTAINQIADRLLQPARSSERRRCADLQEEKVVALCRIYSD